MLHRFFLGRQATSCAVSNVANDNVQCSFNYINQSIYLFNKCTAQKVEGSLISLLNKCYKGNQLFLKVYKFQIRKNLFSSISGNINLDFTYLLFDVLYNSIMNDSSRCCSRIIVISTKVLKSHYFKLR